MSKGGGMEQHFTILEKSSQNENGNVRKAAAQCLGFIHSAHAANILLKLLRDKVWQVREASVKSLGRLGLPETADPLIKLLQAEGDIRKAVMEAASLKAPPPEAQPAAGPMGGGGAKKNEEVWQVKKAVALALSSVKPSIAIEPLLAGLEHENPSVIMASMVELMTLKATKKKKKILPLLNHNMWQVQKTAITVLGRLKVSDVVPSIVSLYHETTNDPVKIEILIALNNIKEEESYPLFLEGIKADNADIRKVAAIALGNTKDDQYVPPLVEALEDQNFAVRKAAIDSLVNLKSLESTEAIVPLLADENDDVQTACSVAIGRLFMIAKV